MENKRFKYSDVFNVDPNTILSLQQVPEIKVIPKSPKTLVLKSLNGSARKIARVSAKGIVRTTTRKAETIPAKRAEYSEQWRSKTLSPYRIKHPIIINKPAYSCLPANISPRVPVKIGEMLLGPGVTISDNENFFGINLAEVAGHDISGYIENGVLIINGFYK
mgnify:CR=1 FL=1